MTLVSGDIKLVTNDPAAVSEVWIRAERPRLHGTSYVVDDNAHIQVRDGWVEFEAIPGPAVMILISGGQPTGQAVKLIIPDAATATLADTIRPGLTYTPDIVSRALQAIIDALEDALAQVDGAVDAAMPGKADTSYVDAGDSALGERIDTRIPETLALRRDTSVGTRIMAGDTMIYGDTGWRDITANNEIIGTVGEGGAVTIRRSGDVVTFRLLGPISADDRGRFEVRDIYTRFAPSMRLYLPMATFDGTFNPQVTQYHFQLGGQPAGQTIVRAQGNVEFTWTTTAPWPTTLPGTPV